MKEELLTIWLKSKELEGKKFFCDNVKDNLEFVEKSKKLANEYKWLYHCTTSSALLNIIKNREFWLSNLKAVNDREEAKRIDVKEYENQYYVLCLTYDSDIEDAHWEEYGNMVDGVLIGVKRNWFDRRAVFMNRNNQKYKGDLGIIQNNYDLAIEDKIIRQKKGELSNPFYIDEFNFYQIIYDDELKKKIAGNSFLQLSDEKIIGQILTPDVAGIIKSKCGYCERKGKETYIKDWTKEKEVRLKVRVQQLDINKNGNKIYDQMIMEGVYFPKIAVPISENAFDEIRIKFSPRFKNKSGYIEELKILLPESKIEII